ncbi:MAG: hypothetical protein AUH89_06350 [Ktedonobacter sp. 13_1_40CM_4_52_4]|nr:MAG: hypothetical protein AUH89_06350 [Ktedonobacter sp. 13_1_40CM_4_52_4]
MAYDDLRQWITALKRAGELREIHTEVDPILEIAEITDRVSKGKYDKSADKSVRATQAGGPALLFQNLKGHPGAQLLINQFGSQRRMNLALEVDSLDEVADRIRHFMDVKSPQGFLDKVKMLPMLAEMGKFFPKTVATGPCKEVIKHDNFSLLDFPILQCWPKDAGRFITLPCVITRDPKTGKRNVGMYRMQIFDERTTGMHWQRQKIGAEHYREALRRAAVEPRPYDGNACGSKTRCRRYHGPLFRRLRPGRRLSPRWENGSRRCHRHRSCDNVFRHRSRAPRCRGISDRRFPAPETRRISEV